jgi:hypothetical protein
MVRRLEMSQEKLLNGVRNGYAAVHNMLFAKLVNGTAAQVSTGPLHTIPFKKLHGNDLIIHVLNASLSSSGLGLYERGVSAGPGGVAR